MAGRQWEDISGANVWGFMTVDVQNGLVFLPIGTPTPDFYGGDRKGSNLYGSSVVALDAATGKMKWFFQTTHHDNWDYDDTAAPVLIDIKRNGKKIPAVAQSTKQGLMFFFDRLTGKPIYDVEERPVLNDNPMPGDRELADAAVSRQASAAGAQYLQRGRRRDSDARAREVLPGSIEAGRRRDDGRTVCAIRAQTPRDFSGLDRRRQLGRHFVRPQTGLCLLQHQELTAC